MKKTRVLLLEDETLIAIYTKELLEKMGCEVSFIAKTCEEALTYIKDNRIDLLIADIKIRGNSDGVVCCERIKSRLDIPVIYLTGNANNYTLQKVIETNPYGIIIKPVNETELYTSINYALSKFNLKKRFQWNEINYKAVLDFMTEGVAVYKAIDEGRDFVFLSINSTSEKLENIKLEDVIGKSVKDIFPNVEPFGLFDALKRVWKSGKAERLQTREYNDERIRGWRENYIYKLLSGEVVAIYSDETEKVEIKTKQKKQLDLMSNVAELSPLAILIFDWKGELVFINKSGENMLGINKNNLHHLTYDTTEWRITDINDNPLKKENLPFYIIKNYQKEIKNFKCNIHLKNNNKIITHISGSPVYNNSGKVEKVIIYIEDISGRIDMETQIKNQNENLTITNEKLSATNSELEAAIDTLKTTNEELISTQNELIKSESYKENLIIEKNERIKELNCLYNVSTIVEKYYFSIDDILKNIVKTIPPAFQYPEYTCAKIKYENTLYETDNFSNMENIIRSPIQSFGKEIGFIEVCYCKKQNYFDDNMFLEEEYQLINSIAERLGKVIERIKSKDTLKQREELLSNITNNVPAFISYVDSNQRYIYVNKAYADWFNCDIENIVGKTIKEVIGETTYQKVEQNIDKVLFNGENVSFENHLKKDEFSKNIIVNTSYIPHKNSDGKVKAFFSLTTDITQLKQLEKDLKEAEKEWRDSFNSLEDAMLIINKDFTIEKINNKVMKLFNKNKDELIGKKCYEILYRRKKPMENCPAVKTKSKKSVEVNEFYNEKLNKYLSVKSSPILNDKNKIIKIVDLISDITHKKQSEKIIKDSEEYHRMLFESNHLTILIINPNNGDIVNANPSACEFYGYKKEELIKKKIWEINILSETEVREEMLKAKEEKRNYFFFTHKLANNDLRSVEVYSGPITLNGKEYLYSIIHDITKQTDAEKALKKSIEKYKLLVNNLHEGILFLDKDLKTTFANPRMAEMLDYNLKELLNQYIFSFIPEDNKHHILEKIDKIKRGIKEQYDCKFVKKFGDKIDVSIEAVPIFDDNSNEFIGILKSVADITERKKFEDKLKKSLKEKEILIKEVHHRVKNNLQIIISLLKLQSKYLKDDKDVEIFKSSENRVRSMALVHEAMYENKNYSNINFKKYIQDLTMSLLYSYNIFPSSVNLNIEVDNTEISLQEALPCAQIVNELLTNSIRYSIIPNRKPIINIRFFRNKDKKFTLIVEDNGYGLPDDIDLENPSSFGFQMVNALIDQLEGHIEINSNEKGTKFIVKF